MRRVACLRGIASGRPYPTEQLMNLDPEDGRPVRLELDLDAIAARCPGRRWLRPERRDLWRYGALLPFDAGDPAEAPTVFSLGEGWTPLLDASDEPFARAAGLRLALKEEGAAHAGYGRNPTASFKDRGMAMVVTMARHFGLRRLAVPTQGNAGDSLCRYARAAGIEVAVVMPEDTPMPILGQVAAAAAMDPGVALELVEGTIREAGERMRERFLEEGYFNCATFQEPGWRIEGKKTLGLEIAEQCGWTLPDAVIYPTGGGTGVLGMHKAFSELLALGAVAGSMPRFYCVQSRVTAPLVEALERGAADTRPARPGHTLATGLNVPAGVGHFEVLRIIRESGGDALAIDEAHMAAVLSELWRRRRWWISPEGAACMAAAARLAEGGVLRAGERVVAVNTGCLSKYLPNLRHLLDGAR